MRCNPFHNPPSITSHTPTSPNILIYVSSNLPLNLSTDATLTTYGSMFRTFTTLMAIGLLLNPVGKRSLIIAFCFIPIFWNRGPLWPCTPFIPLTVLHKVAAFLASSVGARAECFGLCSCLVCLSNPNQRAKTRRIRSSIFVFLSRCDIHS